MFVHDETLDAGGSTVGSIDKINAMKQKAEALAYEASDMAEKPSNDEEIAEKGEADSEKDH
jgi:hypothetical protein